jgi:hypothetical protein
MVEDEPEIIEAAHKIVDQPVDDGREYYKLDPRLERIFGPYSREGSVAPGDFDFLFADETTYQAEIERRTSSEAEEARRQAERLRQRFEVTPESIDDAKPVLNAISHDHVIRDTIERFGREHDVHGDEGIMRALREDTYLRYTVGVRLLELARQFALGDARFSKTPNHPGYDKQTDLMPQEYIALLALAKADGSFKKGYKNDAEAVASGKDGRHRQSADDLIRRLANI